MLKNSFFQLFETLSSSELTAFHQFSKGVYAKQQVGLRLLAYLIEEKKKGKIANIESAFSATFLRKMKAGSDRKRLLNIFSDLHNWLKKFLIFKELESDDFTQKLLLLRVLHRKKLINRFRKSLAQLKKELTANIYDFWQPLKLLLLHHLVYFRSLSIPAADINPSLIVLPSLLKDFYLRASLRYESALINLKGLFAVQDVEIPDLGKTRQAIQSFQLANPYTNLYYWISRLTDNGTEEAYQKVKELFLEFPFATKEDEQEILVYLFNFNGKQFRAGKLDKMKDHFKLLKLGLEKGLLMMDGQFTKVNFQNIVSVACYLEEFEFADQFIQEYGKHLHIPNAKELISLSSTRVLIGREQYRPALKMLSKIYMKEYIYDATRRSYQLICLVELKENPLLIKNYCENFLLFNRRNNSQSAQVVAGFKNFVMVVQKIIKGVPKEEILEFINRQEALVYQTWLQEQIE